MVACPLPSRLGERHDIMAPTAQNERNLKSNVLVCRESRHNLLKRGVGSVFGQAAIDRLPVLPVVGERGFDCVLG